MEEDMQDFVGEFSEPSEIDWDYEFDAYHFYDFTRDESNYEAGEAERWFEVAGSYPHSPLVMKYLGKSISSSSTGKQADVTSGSEVTESTKNCKGTEENVKAKKKPASKPSKQRSSTLMKPTASHLAKLNKADHAQSSCRRSQKASIHMDQRKVHIPHGFDNAATKRQKLEIGYLRKVAQLKHQNVLLHKISTKGGRASEIKTKVTVPREPELVTQQRAQNRRYNAEKIEHAEPRTGTSKARPSNRQMLQAPSSLLPKKGRRQLPEFKVFHLKTMERAKQHSFHNDQNTKNSDFASHHGAADLQRSNSQPYHGLMKKCETLKIRSCSLNTKIFPTKEDIGETKDINKETKSVDSQFPKNEKLAQNPPTELFNKLSLISEMEETVSQPKGHLATKVSKENVRNSFQPEFWKCVSKPNQCGSGRGIPGITHQPNMNRSLGIR